MQYPFTIYLCIHKRIHDKAGLSKMISKKDFYIMLGRMYLIPKNLCPVILKEMEQLDMIERHKISLKEDLLYVRPLKCDPVENVSVIYRNVGIYA